jgi:hypothetical protein
MSLLVSTPILSQLQSPLLRLPGEIRNKIYEHVLGESIPLHVVGFHYSHWGAPYKTHARRLHQINELERTCRKLRAETGNMGSTWNHISLYSGYVDSAIIPNSGPRRVMHYSVEQGQNHNFLRSILHTRYALICKADPLLEVAIFTRALRKDVGCQGLLVLGAALQLMMRGNKLPFQVDAGQGVVQEWYLRHIVHEEHAPVCQQAKYA